MGRTLLVTSSFLPGTGGIESYLAELARELAPDIAVVAPKSRNGKPLPSGLPYPCYSLPGMLLPRPSLARGIAAVASKENTAKLLFGTPWPLVLLAPLLARRGFEYAVIAHGAETVLPGKLPGLRGVFLPALAQARLLLAVSEFTRSRIEELLRARGPLPPSDLLPPRVDLDFFSPGEAPGLRSSLGLGQKDKIVLSLGRLVKRKGNHRLIRAWPEIISRDPQAVAVIAGEGPERKRLQAMARRTGGRILFPGHVSREEARGLYREASVFVLPVADRLFGLEPEGLGVVLLEAQACGTPVVSGRSGGAPEALVEGESGFVVDATEPAELSRAVLRLLADPELKAKMGTRGRDHVRHNFSSRPLPSRLIAWLRS